jgi:hypothetical protein
VILSAAPASRWPRIHAQTTAIKIETRTRQLQRISLLPFGSASILTVSVVCKFRTAEPDALEQFSAARLLNRAKFSIQNSKP